MGIIEIYFCGNLMATINLPVKTKRERKSIGVKIQQGYESTFDIFKERFFKTNGLHFTPLVGGIGSFEEVIYILNRCCDNSSPVSYKVIEEPVLQGEFGIPKGGIN